VREYLESVTTSISFVENILLYVDRKNVEQHFKPRGVKHWFQDISIVVIVG
jgi:hypothetical protein